MTVGYLSIGRRVTILPSSPQKPITRQRSCSTHIVRSAAAVEAPPLAAAGRVKLGSSDLEVSGGFDVNSMPATCPLQRYDPSTYGAECCLGTMTWGQQNTEQEAHHQLSYATDLGVNFIDTAEMYGSYTSFGSSSMLQQKARLAATPQECICRYPIPPKAETKGFTDNYIGSWLRSQKRDNIVLASKVSCKSAMHAHTP